MSEFQHAFADATKANQIMMNSYTAAVSEIENYKLTVATYDQTISDLEQRHASTLQEKETLIMKMQQQINDNLEMLTEHENRKRLDDKFFTFVKWRETIMFTRLRKLQDALFVA